MKAGWEVKTLAEVATVIAGQSPEGKFYNNLGDGLPFYQGKKEFTEKYIGKPTTWTTYITKEAEKDDVLMSVRAPVGPVNFSTEKVCIGRGLAAIRPSRLIDKDFLFNFLLKHEAEIVGNSGAVFDSINKKQIESILIPVPSIQEQQRNVAILDQAFEGIAKARANAEQNLQNARALFESHLQSIFTQCGEGWVEKKLGEVCDLINGFAFKSTDAVDSSNTQLVRMGNLYGNTLSLDRSPVFYPENFAEIYRNFLLVEDDLIMSLTGTTGKEDYGYTVKIPNCSHSLLMNQRIVKFEILNSDLINQNFLMYYLRSRVFLDTLYSTANGTRQANLSSVVIKTLPIPICSFEEQLSISTKLDEISEETHRLEALYQRKIACLDELKKSLLQQAFAGEL